MELHQRLLAKNGDPSEPDDALDAQARGLYHPRQFVLWLSPDIHRELSSTPAGITTNSKVGWKGAEAMSTYLHETIHWWQHIGTTHGFISSLNYPVQAHSTFSDLRLLINKDGFKKSVYLHAKELGKAGHAGPGTSAATANTIVNNHFDLLAFKAFTHGPDGARALAEEQLLESVGHAFWVTYSNTINALASTVDRNFTLLPNPETWASEYQALKEKRSKGYYYGSPIDIWPLGAYQIFEGQARFSQIQYLSNCCGHSLSWDAFRKEGMLSGVYVRAFEEFLRLTESPWPDRVNDPIVGLFLLVCDLSANPASGFPLSATVNSETFMDDVNPGARFWHFCRLITLFHPELKLAIKTHSRSEYKNVSEVLCNAAKEGAPLQIADLFRHWFKREGPLASLRKEFDSYDFKPENFVIRHLFAHFLAFQEDKYRRPEFFCWPGAWMAGEMVNSESLVLFEKQGALFVNRENEEGVFAFTQAKRDTQSVESTFNSFYQNQTMYGLIDQWISKPGAFVYDYSWLTVTQTAELKEFLGRQFKAVFGVIPEDATILDAN